MASSSAQQNQVEIITGCYKRQTGFLWEIKKVLRLSIGFGVLEGKKKIVGCFEQLNDHKIRLKQLTFEINVSGTLSKPTKEKKMSGSDIVVFVLCFEEKCMGRDVAEQLKKKQNLS